MPRIRIQTAQGDKVIKVEDGASDADLEEIATEVKQKFSTPTPEEPGFVDKAKGALSSFKDYTKDHWEEMATRAASPIAGSMAGSAVGTMIAPGPGTVVGGVLGGLLGGGGGEYGAEHIEQNKGLRTDINPKQVAMQAALGMIPGANTAKIGSIPLRIAADAGAGALMGAGSSAATEFAESGHLPSKEALIQAAVLGGVTGGTTRAGGEAFGAGINKLRGLPQEIAGQDILKVAAQFQPEARAMLSLPAPSGRPITPAPDAIQVPPGGFRPDMPPTPPVLPQLMAPGQSAIPMGAPKAPVLPQEIPFNQQLKMLPAPGQTAIQMPEMGASWLNRPMPRSPGEYPPLQFNRMQGIPQDLPMPPPAPDVPASYPPLAFNKQQMVRPELPGALPEPKGDTLEAMQARMNLPPQEPPKVPAEYAKQAMVRPERPPVKVDEGKGVATLDIPATDVTPPSKVTTSVEKEPGLAAIALSPTRKWLAEMGAPGQEFVKRADDALFDNMSMTGKWESQALPHFKGMNDKDFAQISLAQEGKATLSPKMQGKQQALKAFFDDVKTTIQQVDPDFQGVENYWPHLPKPEFLKQLMTEKGKKSYTDWLLKQGVSEEQIPEVMRSVMNRETTFKSGNIMNDRKNLIPEEFIRRDKGVLTDYINSTAKHLSDAKNFGRNYEQLYKLVGDLSVPANRTLMTRIIHKMGQQGAPLSKADRVLQKIRSFNTVTLLDTFSTFTNMGQRLNAFGVEGSGIPSTIKSLASPYTKTGKQFAERAGVISHSAMDSAERTGREGVTSKYLKLIQFDRVEKGNRIVSANLGAQIAKDHFRIVQKTGNDFSKSVLDGLGIDINKAIRRGNLNEDDLIRAAQKVTQDINFFSTPLDLPMWMSGGQGTKTLTQFKNMAYQQSVFMKKVVANALKDPKNSGLNLLYLLAAGSTWAGGQTVLRDMTKGKDTGKEFAQHPIKKGIEIAMNGPGFGLMGDILSKVQYGPKAMELAIMGNPSVSLAARLAEGAYKATQPSTARTNRFEPLAKTIVSRVPLVGRSVLQPKLFPEK